MLRFREAQRKYKAKERAGTLTDVEEVEFYRLYKTEAARVRKYRENRLAAQKLLEDTEESLFMQVDDVDMEDPDDFDDGNYDDAVMHDDNDEDADDDVDFGWGARGATVRRAKGKKKPDGLGSEQRHREPKATATEGNKNRVQKLKQRGQTRKDKAKNKEKVYSYVDIGSLTGGNLVSWRHLWISLRG